MGRRGGSDSGSGTAAALEGAIVAINQQDNLFEMQAVEERKRDNFRPIVSVELSRLILMRYCCDQESFRVQLAPAT
jgi:hypothetical protein